MTYAAFLQRLAETPRDWRVTERGTIRRKPKDFSQCPVSGCVNEPSLHFIGVAQRLGLSMELLGRITRSADNAPFCNQSVRVDLLRACGLSEDEKVESE